MPGCSGGAPDRAVPPGGTYIGPMTADRPCRIPPLAPDERSDEAKQLLAGAVVPGTPASNIFATLVRHPGLTRRWLPFGGKVLSGKLPARLRELLILRTGWWCRSEYEWGQHVLIARLEGLGDDEIARVPEGPDAPGWNELESAVLRAADELHESSTISDGTWSLLAARLSEQQLIEVPMVVGHYHMIAFTLNALGVPREPGVPGFGDWQPGPG